MMKTFIILFFLSLSSSVLMASSAVSPTVEELTAGAEEIVYAEVKKIVSHFVTLKDQEERSIFYRQNQTIISEITADVVKSYKGNLRGVLALEQPGGCVLDKCLVVSLYPNFLVGQRVILFLERNGTTHLQSIMGEYGRYIVDETGNVVRTGDSIEKFEKRIAKIVRVQDKRDPSFFLRKTQTWLGGLSVDFFRKLAP